MVEWRLLLSTKLTDCRHVDWFFHKCMRCRCSECRWLQPSVVCGGSNSNRACSPKIWGQSTKMIWWRKHRLVMELWNPCWCTFVSQLLLCVNANDNDVIAILSFALCPSVCLICCCFWRECGRDYLELNRKLCVIIFSSAYKNKLVNLALFAAGWFQIPIVSVWYFVYDFTWKILQLINIKRAQRMYCTHADLRPHYIICYERIGPCTSTNATHLSYTEAKKMRKTIKFATFETIAIKWNHQAPTRFTTWKFTRRWFEWNHTDEPQ